MKRIKILLIALILIVAGVFYGKANAANVTRSLGAQMERPFETKAKYQYAVKGETEGSTLWYTVVKIYDNESKDFSKYTKPIYCLRGGKGFGIGTDNQNTDVSEAPINYIQEDQSEMHENADRVIEKYKELYGIDLNRNENFKIDSSVDEQNVEVNIYNAILWVLDESYLPKDKINSENKTVYSASEYKQELLDKAGVPRIQQGDITDNDIEVIQQLAMWYFTNYDEQQANTNPTVSQSTIYPAQFLSINGNNNIDFRRENNLNRIYRYLVYGAINNAATYPTTGARTRKIEKNEFDKTEQIEITSNDSYGLYSFYKIGPIKIKTDINEGNARREIDSTNILLYDAEGKLVPKFYLIPEDEALPGVKSYNLIYRFVDKDGNEATSLQTGIEYYIRFYKFFEKGSETPEFITDDDKYDMSEVSIKVTSSYTNSTATFMYSEENASDNQAVVEIDKEKISEGDEIVPKKEFDLALRKYITKVTRNGNNVSVENERSVDNNDTTRLNAEDATTGVKTTTAEYKHRKDPVEVQTGDTVTYTIKIYNEGEMAGRASKIIDQLPKGLKYSKINTEGYTATYDEATNRLTITKTGTNNIAAYKTGKLSSETIEIECVVEAIGENQVLTNLAWIAEEIDEKGTVITTEVGKDRDSEPGTIQTKTAEELVTTDIGYTGKNEYTEEQLKNSNNYYEGQQDDDDFEKIRVKLEKIEVPVIKLWIDNNNQDGKRPEKVTIKLLADGVDTGKVLELSKANQWNGKFTDLPKYNGTKQIKYTIKEEPVPTGYTGKITENEPTGFTVTNTYIPEKTEIPVTKVWSDNNNQDGKRAEKVTIKLLADGVDTGKALELSETNQWTGKFTDLPKYNDGEEIEYTIKEEPVPTEYSVNITGNKTEGFTVTNTYTPEKIEIPVTKVWNDGNDQDKKRPEGIVIKLLADGVDTEKTLELNEANQWTGKFTGLEKYKDGKEIEYTIEESAVEGYTVEITGSKTEGFTVTNTYTPEKIEIPVTKVWDDENNKDKIRPESIVVNLKKGTEIVKTATLNKDNNWSYKFENLAKNENGEEIVYTVEEVVPEGYTATIEGNMQNGFKITNKHEVKRPFDLSLRKYITEINGSKLEGDKERTPKIDTSELIKGEATTAKYVHPKNAVTVKKGDIVTYKIRVYNEGERNGYATKVTDYLPEGLGFLPEYTKNNIWSIPKKVDETTGNEVLPEGTQLQVLVGENGLYKSQEDLNKTKIKLEDFKDPITGEIPKDYSKINIVTGEKLEVSTSELKDKLIKAYKSEKAEGDLWQESTNDEKDGLFYQELEITCIVLKENTYPGILKNVAEITAAEDTEGNEIKNVGDDRDSEPNNVYEDGEHTPGVEKDGYTPGEQDDDDFEALQLKYFDLALRKFITKVDERAPETSREPEVDVSTLIEGTFNRNGKLENTATYKHPKDPLLVKNGSNVEYTIRVYNEGTEDGYAYEIADDIPEGLIYDPENETNKEYGWVMYREIGEGEKDLDEKDIIEYNNKKYIKTTQAEEATMIRTRYLEDKLIKSFNAETKELSYEDVKVMFTVYETENIDPDRIIINEAQITEDSGDDEDSTPNKWQDEDDEDIEKVRIPIFDLSLLKWVTKTTVTVDGKTTVTETGFKPNTGKTETTGIRSNEAAEPIAKVEVDRKKLNKTTVKFTYKIRVTNEGEIEGFATKITDFIPEGLEFKEEDNKAYGWVKEGENKVTTRATETVLLQPGESTEVEIVFTWKNGTNNLGLKTNIAEITEDYNDYNTDDIDSTPNNKKDPYEKEQEDDDDFALVILSIKTGKGASYAVFTTAMVTLLAGGIYLVKRYVLTY